MAVSVHAMGDADWQPAGGPGQYLKPVRADREAARYLGLVRIDRDCRTGLHQHLDVASSYFLTGSLTDYAGSAVQGQVGINLAGDTHDAISYDGCVLAARLDGPVVYAPAGAPASKLHTGATNAAFRPLDANRLPDLNITVAAQRPTGAFLDGVLRRPVFDYAGTGHARRIVALQMQPGAKLPPHRAGGLIEWFVIAGGIAVNERSVGANSFVVIEPDSEARALSAYGCLLLAWAEGPVRWQDAERPDLYGF